MKRDLKKQLAVAFDRMDELPDEALFSIAAFEAMLEPVFLARFKSQLLEQGHVTEQQITASDCQGIRGWAGYAARLMCKGLNNKSEDTMQRFRKHWYLKLLRFDVLAFLNFPVPERTVRGMSRQQVELFRNQIGGALRCKASTSLERLSVYAYLWDFLPIPLRYFTRQAAADFLANEARFVALAPKNREMVTPDMVDNFQEDLGLKLKAPQPPVVHGFYQTRDDKGKVLRERIEYDDEALKAHPGLTIPAEFRPNS